MSETPAVYSVDLSPILDAIDAVAKAADHGHEHVHTGFAASTHQHDFSAVLAKLVEVENAFKPVAALATQAQEATSRHEGEIDAFHDALVRLAGHQHEAPPAHRHAELDRLDAFGKMLAEHHHPTQEDAFLAELMEMKARLDALVETQNVAEQMGVARVDSVREEAAIMDARLTEVEKGLGQHGHKDPGPHEHKELATAKHEHEGLGHNHDYAKPEKLADGTLVYRCKSCSTVFTVGG